MRYKILIITSFILLSCGSKTPPKNTSGSGDGSSTGEQKVSEKILKSVTPSYKEQFTLGSQVKIGYTAPGADSVHIFVDGEKISSETYISDRVGRIGYMVTAFKGGESNSLNGQITVFADKTPLVKKINVVRKYPHDPMAYTQGLLFENGKLYESTGERGRSSIREVELTTGKVLRKRDLERKFFGEGLALLKGKFYQLTWQEGVVLVYDRDNFENRTEFPLSGEGWGITTDGTYLYVTDGTNRISKYDPSNFKKISHIEVADNKQMIQYLNELEWIDGKIWANVYTSDLVAIINPETGVVEKYLDCSNLVGQIGNRDKADVLNGIAYDKSTKKIWLTGKDWDTLFEVVAVP